MTQRNSVVAWGWGGRRGGWERLQKSSSEFYSNRYVQYFDCDNSTHV